MTLQPLVNALTYQGHFHYRRILFLRILLSFVISQDGPKVEVCCPTEDCLGNEIPLRYLISSDTFTYIYIDCWVPIQASHNSSNVEYPPCTDFNCTVADRLDIILPLFWYLHHFLNVL